MKNLAIIAIRYSINTSSGSISFSSWLTTIRHRLINIISVTEAATWFCFHVRSAAVSAFRI